MQTFVKLRFIYPLIWYALILYALLTPSNKLPDVKLFAHFDKLVHFLIFFVFAVLLSAAFLKNKQYNRSYLFAGIVAFINGIVFELLQKYTTTTRSGSFDDAIANTLGVLFGLLFYHFVIRDKYLERIFFRIDKQK